MSEAPFVIIYSLTSLLESVWPAKSEQNKTSLIGKTVEKHSQRAIRKTDQIFQLFLAPMGLYEAV